MIFLGKTMLLSHMMLLSVEITTNHLQIGHALYRIVENITVKNTIFPNRMVVVGFCQRHSISRTTVS